MSASPSTHPDNSGTPLLHPKTGRGEGHDPRGRFTPGNRCGHGNPVAKQAAALRQALRAAIRPEDITDIAEVLRELALDGNLAAIRLLLSYVVGRPGTGDEEDEAPPPQPLAAPEESTPEPLADAPEPVAQAVASSLAVQPKEMNPKKEEPQPQQPPSVMEDYGNPVPRPPSATADNGSGTRPPPSPPADNGERPPNWAIRRWPR